jgi:hypothetical protein
MELLLAPLLGGAPRVAVALRPAVRAAVTAPPPPPLLRTLLTDHIELPLLNCSGACVAVALPGPSAGEGGAEPLHCALGAVAEELHPSELAWARGRGSLQRGIEFAAGRVALRRALSLAGSPACGALLPDASGAPEMPGCVGDAQLLGSISHTRSCRGETGGGEAGGGGGGGGLAVALVAAVRGGARGRVGVGVDVESARRRPSERLARRVLAPVEREAFEADLAEISPRSTEISRRCGRDAAEMRPRCSRGVAEG